MSVSALWAELREFIRRLRIEEAEQRSLRRDLLALANDMRDAWTTVGGNPLALLNGQVDACNSFGFAGALVEVFDHATAVKLASVLADPAGQYTARFGGAINPRNVDVVATATGPFAARFGGPVTLNVPAATYGDNAVSTITIPPAATYCCVTGQYQPEVCAAGLSGTVKGCGSLGFPGATVTIKDHATGTTLDTQTTNGAGAWSSSITLSSNPQSLDIVASPTGYAARFTGDVTTTISAHPGTNAGVSQTFTPDTTNYICTSFRFYPIKLTLQLVDSVNGTAFSFTYNSGFAADIPNAWNGGINLPYPGCPAHGCAPVNPAVYAYSLDLLGHFGGYYIIVPGGGTCPSLATSGAFFTGDVGGTPTFTDGPFTATFTVLANTSLWYCASSATITITEI